MGDIGIELLYGALGLGLVLGSGVIGKFSMNMKIAPIAALLLEGILNMIISQSSWPGGGSLHLHVIRPSEQRLTDLIA